LNRVAAFRFEAPSEGLRPAAGQSVAGVARFQKLNQWCLRGWNFISERWEKPVLEFRLQSVSRFEKDNSSFGGSRLKSELQTMYPKSEIALPSTEAESSAISNL